MIKVHRNSKGFTLIELLIVIAIIGILAAIAIPAYTGYTKKAKVSGVVNAMGAVKNAILAYYTESGNLGATGVVASNAALVGSTFGVTIPTQYTADANVGTTWSANAIGVNIMVTLANIGSGADGGIVNLATTNIADGSKWTFTGNNSELNTLLPK